MIRTMTAALVLGLALIPLAHAKRGNDELKRYCSGDAATFCGDVEPGGGEIEACFRKHRTELSKGCRRAIDAYRGRGGR